ncbi:hypothetical protein [Pontibacter amylolyticus]|uniref:NigD-like protein n=1 Tax=Pontibacter amylolyticus TaxID=1424080 RepID=A0ABQ1VY47_9BACT|nr:hypothetical protein [Pontibacter amylolyticus]GGG05291.1 hypothetical protein GCM10011323_07550 [Pontibacter amylolyticus]
MTHRIKLAGAFMLATLLFTSCKDCDTTTTQFDEKDVEWLVYDRGDTVRFLNEVGDTVAYTNTALIAEQVPGEGYNVSDNCIGHFDIQAYSVMEDVARNSTSTDKNPGIMTYFLKRENSLEVALAVDKRGEYKLNLTQPTYPSVEVNDVLYTDVYEVINNDASKVTNVKRILYNKQRGFLSVEFYNDKKLELIF